MALGDQVGQRGRVLPCQPIPTQVLICNTSRPVLAGGVPFSSSSDDKTLETTASRSHLGAEWNHQFKRSHVRVPLSYGQSFRDIQPDSPDRMIFHWYALCAFVASPQVRLPVPRDDPILAARLQGARRV